MKMFSKLDDFTSNLDSDDIGIEKMELSTIEVAESDIQMGFNGEIQLTDAMSKLDEIYGVKFTGKVFNIENRLEWIKSSIDYAMADEEFKGDLNHVILTLL